MMRGPGARRLLAVLVPLALVTTMPACGGQARPDGNKRGGPPVIHVSPPPNRPGTPITVEFVGASVTEGQHASREENEFPHVVVTRLDRSGRPAAGRIIAKGGTRSGQALAWDLSQPADVIVVQFGGNDFPGGVPVETFQTNYREILDRVRAASPRATLLCLGLWNDPDRRNQITVTVSEYDQVVQRGCAAHKGTYVPLGELFNSKPNHGPAGTSDRHGVSDYHHPNDEGHHQIAMAVVGALRRSWQS
jgi:acyl-CoA thioesterase I